MIIIITVVIILILIIVITPSPLSKSNNKSPPFQSPHTHSRRLIARKKYASSSTSMIFGPPFWWKTAPSISHWTILKKQTHSTSSELPKQSWYFGDLRHPFPKTTWVDHDTTKGIKRKGSLKRPNMVIDLLLMVQKSGLSPVKLTSHYLSRAFQTSFQVACRFRNHQQHIPHHDCRLKSKLKLPAKTRLKHRVRKMNFMDK